jgi:hypothetical protein
MKINHIRILPVILSVIGVILVASFMVATSAHANPSSYKRAQSAAATTTLSYLSPGVASTTLATLDAIGGNNFAIGGTASLLLQLTGSTTVSTLYATTTYAVAFEYSQDGVDWYADELRTSSAATTTVLRQRNIAGVAIATTTPTKLIISVPTPTRYVRPVITIPADSTNGAVWGEWVAQKEVQ